MALVLRLVFQRCQLTSPLTFLPRQRSYRPIDPLQAAGQKEQYLMRRRQASSLPMRAAQQRRVGDRTPLLRPKESIPHLTGRTGNGGV